MGDPELTERSLMCQWQRREIFPADKLGERSIPSYRVAVMIMGQCDIVKRTQTSCLLYYSETDQ